MRPRHQAGVTTTAGVALLAILLTACGVVTPAPSLSQPTAIPAATSTILPATPTLDEWGGKPPLTITGDPAEARMLTATARTPVPTLPPEPLTPAPTPTWALGFDSCTNANSHGPQVRSCWRGMLNGEMMSVGGGQEGWPGDPSQGLLIVNKGPLYVPRPENIYPTPQTGPCASFVAQRI